MHGAKLHSHGLTAMRKTLLVTEQIHCDALSGIAGQWADYRGDFSPCACEDLFQVIWVFLDTESDY
jgi:hypothetical protein